jgi:predicted NAD/FAD-dependent oxidoreductase
VFSTERADHGLVSRKNRDAFVEVVESSIKRYVVEYWLPQAFQQPRHHKD